MSDYEHIRGKMIKVTPPKGVTLHEHCSSILKDAGYGEEMPKYYDNVIQWIGDELYHEYAYLDGNLYKYLEKVEEDPYDSFASIERDGDVIRFVSRFYNGGTCLTEMLEHALEIERKEDEIKGPS